MIVFVSDLHLTDGTSGETIHAGAFAAFRERLRDMVYDASWRSDGKYRPLGVCHVVLLGDILDVIRSTKWLAGNVRPWSPSGDSAFAARVSEITQAVLGNNKESIAILKSLSQGQVITIPPATADGKPAIVSRDPKARERVPVQVLVHYLVGNHDWFFHLSGTFFNEIRTTIVTAVGLVNPADTPFPHDPYESEELKQAYQQHQVFARHGDIFDSFNYSQDRNTSSLGDAIVVELLNKFPEEVQKQIGDELPEECSLGLREIDNVRPLMIVPVWISGLLRRTCSDAMAKKIKSVWDSLVDQFLDVSFVQEHHSVAQLFDDVSKLEWALKFSKGVSLANLSNMVEWCKTRLGIREGAFYPNAFAESEFKNRSARYVVYGHTHHYEIVPLDTVKVATGLMEQIYFNSGTWRAVHELAQLHPTQQEFVGYHVMTYVAFFKDDERKGRRFECWSGALDKSFG
jgi:UDP-2,3-diacylglucosamine pyrophosphatase LpxH